MFCNLNPTFFESDFFIKKNVLYFLKLYVQIFLMQPFIKYLQQFPNFNVKAIEMALPFVEENNIKAGEFLLSQGNICNHISYIENGLFRQFYLNEGKEITTCFCNPNTITCDYQSFITQKSSMQNIQALEVSKVCSISYDHLQELYKKNDFWQQVGRLAAENEYITSQCHYRFINDLTASERYLQILENDSDLLHKVPLNYLASYLQITPETLSRIRKKIART